MRCERRRRTLRGVPGSLTRRQLLIRTGGASVAIVCFGALPVSATADPAALSSARAATFAAILDAIDADPGYELADRAERVGRFADIYTAADDGFRAYADAVLDARHLTPEHLDAAALDLAAVPYLEPSDSHPILFTLT
jgi:hypothetical protein